MKTTLKATLYPNGKSKILFDGTAHEFGKLLTLASKNPALKYGILLAAKRSLGVSTPEIEALFAPYLAQATDQIPDEQPSKKAA